MSLESMKIVFSIPSLGLERGGPSRCVPALAAALAETPGLEVRLVTLLPRGETFRPPAAVRPLVRPTTTHAGFSRALHHALSGPGPRFLHDNGTWTAPNLLAAAAARSAGAPLVLSPHGMLEPWALDQHRLKKQLALGLYQLRVLNQAAMLHATADQEAINLRAIGCRPPIAVVPNMVDPPADLPRRPTRGPRRALFLSRIHPKKGLPDLMRAWAALRPAGWELRVVGPDEGGHRREVEALALELGLGQSVSFHGPVGDEEKWRAMAAADLFVLPSHSENFGIVVAEALAAGAPVLTTTATPWRLLEQEGCGWWIPPGLEALTAALDRCLALPPARLAEMGAVGRAAAAARFSPAAVAASMASAYRWLHSGSPGGAAPGCIRGAGETTA